jgi:hypothetical protein
MTEDPQRDDCEVMHTNIALILSGVCSSTLTSSPCAIRILKIYFFIKPHSSYTPLT